jgi:DnaJ family protein C protein 19
MIRIVLALLAIMGVWYVMWKYRRLPEETRKKTFLQICLISLAVALVVLVASGRAHWIFALLGGVVAFASRLLPYLRHLPMLAKVLATFGIVIPGMAQAASSSAIDTNNMSREDAAAILGVDNSANDQQVLSAHKSLMNKMHPDKGGSGALAAQINAARDVMLRK